MIKQKLPMVGLNENAVRSSFLLCDEWNADVITSLFLGRYESGVETAERTRAVTIACGWGNEEGTHTHCGDW